MYDVLIQNNLFENITGGVPFTGNGNGISFTSSSLHPPGWNVVIDRNTVFNCVDFIGFDSKAINIVASGLTVTNNVGDYDIAGTSGNAGSSQRAPGHKADLRLLHIRADRDVQRRRHHHAGHGPCRLFQRRTVGYSATTPDMVIPLLPLYAHRRRRIRCNCAPVMVNGEIGYFTIPVRTPTTHRLPR